MTDLTKAMSVSAGTNPGSQVHPVVAEVKKEVDIELSRAVPQKLTDQLAQESNLLVTMGCGEACPFVPGLGRDDWPLQDSKGLPIEEVRRIRVKVRKRVGALVGGRYVRS